MSFWFDHLPESYPNHEAVIDQAGLLSGNGDPREGVNYLLGMTASLPFSPIKDEYSHYVRFRFAENQLANPMISAERKIGVFTALFAESTRELANSVADMGKAWSLTDDEGERQIGLRLLEYAANSFEKVVANLDEETPFETRFEVITEDYSRITALQDEAGDKAGAAATATTIAPHLIALSKERLTKNQRIGFDLELELTALHIAAADPVMAEELLKVMSEKHAKSTRRILEQERVNRLISSASEEDIDGLLRSFGDEPGFRFWHDVFDLVKDENDTRSLERARWLIAHVDRNFPTLFDEANERLLAMIPVEPVLFFIGRDDLLAKYYTSLVRAQGVGMMSKFAGECGAKDDAIRFQSMIRATGLSPEQSKKLYDTYFEPVRDRQQDGIQLDD